VDRTDLEVELIALCNKYLNSDWIKMKDVLRGLRSDLTKNGFINEKQFLSVIGLIRKERKYNNLSDERITSRFSPLFTPPPASTLEQFFNY